MQRTKLRIDITGPDGNIYFLLIKVREILRKQKRINDYNELWEEIQKGSYSRALYLINQVVELVDISETKALTKLLKDNATNN